MSEGVMRMGDRLELIWVIIWPTDWVEGNENENEWLRKRISKMTVHELDEWKE